MRTPLLRVEDFDYDLPERFIAQRPAEPRDSSRLLCLDRASGALEHRVFSDLPEILRPGDLLVLNDTKVIPARLIGSKTGTGGKVEVLLLHRSGMDTWETLVKPGRRLRNGARLTFGEGELRGEIVGELPSGGRLVRFRWRDTFEEALQRLGEMPLPPYIKASLEHPERYQTVYAAHEGSAAAPTAGLHFTNSLLDRLVQKGVETTRLTLHVGLGTFRPVNAATIDQHVMHAEYYRLPEDAASAINRTREAGGRVVSVGTTAARTLETAADESGKVRPGDGWTDIFIYPGYDFKCVDALITNFHLPKSTLLMLVGAFAGRRRILDAYEVAKRKAYRFYSFGDAMLIE